MRRLALLVFLAAISMLTLAGQAYATGPCGNDFDGNSACALNTPYSTSGTIASENETDYYVFHTSPNTQINISITDTESPTCSEYGCGYVGVELYDASGSQLISSNWSEPQNGITVPATESYVIKSAGTYYLVVYGSLGDDQYGNNRPVPYSLGVTASPTVVWPYVRHAPPPARVRAVHSCPATTERMANESAHMRFGRVSAAHGVTCRGLYTTIRRGSVRYHARPMHWSFNLHGYRTRVLRVWKRGRHHDIIVRERVRATGSDGRWFQFDWVP